ncbi:hypothetical protein Tco_0982073 [Tanacetum coccineum]
MTCSVPHNDDEIQALVQKLIDEDMVHNDIPQESRALIDNFLKEGYDKDYELNLSIGSVEEHEIVDEYLTEKEQQQLLLDEEAFRETLEEETRAEKERARAEKEWEERMKEEQAHDELFRLEFGGFAAALSVLVTEVSQSRQHDKSESDKYRKSPTTELFDGDSGKISIFTVNTKEYHSDVLEKLQG